MADIQKQNEIKVKTKLLDENGYVLEPGWARHNSLIEYNRDAISAHPLRIKEWDFYEVSNDRFMMQFTIANISMAEAGCITVTDMKTGLPVFCAAMAHIYTVNRFPMPRQSDQPFVVDRNYGYFKMHESYDGKSRHLSAKGIAIWPTGLPFTLEMDLAVPEGQESISISIPWKKKDAPGSKKMKDHFFFTNKENCMPATGFLKIGPKKLKFDKSNNSFGVLDWGRGVWAHNIRWIWGNGTTYINDKLFGFEITFGFGDDSDATETCLFYDGVAHKLGKVTVDYDHKHPKSRPWVFHEENGRFELTMDPFFNSHIGIDIGIVGAHTDQCTGLWNGTVTLDDGTVLEIKDMQAFCEQVHSKW